MVRAQKLVGRLLSLRFVGWLANLPPVAWATRVLVRTVAKRHIGEATVHESTIARAARAGLDANLEDIVKDAVNCYGYVAAAVATYEQGDSLPVRAVYVDGADEGQIHTWEKEISQYSPEPVSVTDPDIARSFVYRDEFKNNLSIRAINAGEPVVDDELYSLCTPVAPPASRAALRGIQDALGIRQVMAVPFFIETSIDGQSAREVVGNLFVCKSGEFTTQDKLLLSALGRQAAAAIESERRRLQIQITQELVLAMQTSMQDEEKILQWIAEGVVSKLGYVGAIVATYEPDDSLPVRATYVDPQLAEMDQIHAWEEEISQYSPEPVSITDPDIARAFINQDEFQDNLSVRAIKAGGPATCDEFYDFCKPVAPANSKHALRGIQDALGINKMIAVPFFLETLRDGQPVKQLVGNLIAATRSRQFFRGEIELLELFGQQAAIGIHNARLYRKAEERRHQAQIFAKMAFSAATSVHALRNHVGLVRGQVQLLQMIDELPADKRQKVLDSIPKTMSRLDKIADILDTLHEPWREVPDSLVDVNRCLVRALDKVIPIRDRLREREGYEIHQSLPENLPSIKTSSVMLAEAFRVLIKNAVDAIKEMGFLFSVGLEYQGDLEAEELSEPFQREFERRGITLAYDLDFEPQEGGDEWWITDNDLDRTYIVRRKVEALNIYEMGNGGDLWVESRLGENSSDVEVLVRDSGIGIEPENLGKIFEMRWTTKDVGMGFGLFWTKDYIDGMGGKIEVESVWQKGTTFYVSLPICVEQTDVS
jgi:signal transduction histidine kinase